MRGKIRYMFLYSIVIICICFQSERGVFDFLSYLRLFRQLKQNNPKNSAKFTKQILFILVPVLREQLIIENTILKFCEINNPNFEIVIIVITSIREKINKNTADHATTEDVMIQSLSSGKLLKYKNNIRLFKDPSYHGNMATQLNYAIREIKKTEQNAFYLVYNADSIISVTTFEKLTELMEQHPNEEFAFQQPCAFIRDLSPDSNQFTNALSLYQSWYCLGHESRLVYNYGLKSEKNWGKRNNTKLGIVVGHGSGMTFNINTNNKSYPTDLLTEDLTFGFILSANNVPILSLTALELADVPNCFTNFVKQKSVWFWNFLGYINCYKKMRKQGHPRSQLITLFIEGLGAGAYWFFDTFFIIVPFFLSIVLESYLVAILSLVSFFIFYIVPQYLLLKKLPDVLDKQGFPSFADNARKVSFIKLFPSLCLIILTNSVGAWIATIKSVPYFISGKLPEKYKTGD